MKKRILFVDDSQYVLDGLKRMLHDRSKEWDVVSTTSPKEVSELLHKTRIDAAVLDAQMPEKNGLVLLNEIKSDSRTRDIEVIILTGIKDDSLKRQALNFGAADLLNKPVTKEDLIARLNNVLRLKTYHDKLIAQNQVLEQQLIQSQKIEAIGMLAEGVTHDFKSILTIIRAFSNYMFRYLNADSKTNASLKEINKACEHGNSIVKEILSYSKQKEHPPEELDIGEAIDNSIDLIKNLVPRDVKIEWVNPEKKYIIKAVSTQINQLFLTLCINVIQNITNGGVLKISITEAKMVNTENHSKAYLKLQLSSIDESVCSKVQQSDADPHLVQNNFQEKPKLGLSITKKIVENHDGLISIENNIGPGNSFSIYLPHVRSNNSIH